MSKSVQPGGPVAFDQSDMLGTWRIYLQRVEAKLAGSTTQIGQTTFNSSGGFVSAQLTDGGSPSTTTMLTTGGLLVTANGSVTGSLSVGTAATGDRYTLIGSMRAAKDVITGVLTANLSARTKTHYGLVTMVRDVTLFDLSQPSYTVTEGNALTVTVKRTGNLTAPASVNWAVTGGLPGDFDGPTTGTLSFGPGAASQALSVKTSVNTLIDGDRSASITLSAPSGPGAMLGSLVSAPLNIIDEDRAGAVRLSANAYPVAEGAKNAVITLLRAGTNLASNVSVQFQITDGTALAGRDYSLPANTSVTFAAGATMRTVSVPILENTIVDGPRTFTFALTGISPGTGKLDTPSSATVTITDNDVAGTLQFSAATSTVAEGNTSTITVLRRGGSAGGVLVDFTTADGTGRAGHNYTATSGTLTFESTNMSKTFTVSTLNDAVIEGDNTVLLSLNNPRLSTDFAGAKVPMLGALKTAVLTIKDAQKGVQFSSSNYSVAETAGMATISVIRTGPLSELATVRYSTTDGTARAGLNYVATSGVLSFGPGVGSQSFPVKILPDKIAGGARTVVLLLSGNASVGIGPRRSAVLRIGDKDAGGVVKLSSATYSVNESAGTATITVTRSGGAAGGVSVVYATADQPCGSPPCAGLAHAGQDYEATSGVLTFGPGEMAKTIKIPIAADTVAEGNATFVVSLSDVQGGATLGTPNEASVTIINDDQGGVVQFSATSYTVRRPLTGSGNVSITLTRMGNNLASGASVLLLSGTGTATPGINYNALAQTVVFDQNARTATVPLIVFGDPLFGGGDQPVGNLTVPLTLMNPGGGATLGAPRNALVTIVDSRRSVRFSAPSYTVNEGGTATITVLRGGPLAGTLTVPFSTANGSGNASALSSVDYVAKSTTLTFGPGVTSQTVTVSTLKRAGPNGDRALMLSLGTPSPAEVGIPPDGGTATLTIRDVDHAGTFQFAPTVYNVVEGGVVTLTVTRTSGSAGAVNVPWHVSGNVSVTPTSGNVSFAAGMLSKMLMLTAAPSTSLDGDRSFSVALDTPVALAALLADPPTLGLDSTAAVTVRDTNRGGTIQFARAVQTVAENIAGGMVGLMVTRTGTRLAGDIMVDYAVTGNTSAIASPLTGTLTFARGQTVAMIAVTLVPPDAGAQPDRVVVVTLSNPRSSSDITGPTAPTLGALASTTVTVTDALAHVQFSSPAYSVTEGDSAAITVTRTGPVGAPPVVVTFATSDGSGVATTDYTPVSGTLTITGAAGKATFFVPTKDDGALAGTRTVVLNLTSPTGGSLGTPSQAVLTLQERESAGVVQFATPALSAVEGSTARVTVSRSGANLTGGVTVGWSATGGSATPNTDFTPASGTLTFGPGVTSQTFEIAVADDNEPEGTETIVLSLEPPAGGATLGNQSTMTVFVIDRQQTVGFARPAVSVAETAPSVTLSIVRTGVPDEAISVRAQTVDGSALAGQDYVARNDVVQFAVGEIVKPFAVPILSQNASRRNGSRLFSVVLSEPVDATINAANASAVTILDFRPDLVILSLAAPSATLTGKAVPTPSTVQNIGPVEAPPFSIGLYIVRTADFDAANPRAGSLVATQAVGRLAAGASAAFPTQFTLDDSFPAGDYYLSAVANFDNRVAEVDTSNNGRSSFPTAIKVSRALKFKSASASFIQTSATVGPPARPAPVGAPAAAPTTTCDITGSVNLTGTFTVSDQQGDTAIGQASLTGNLGGVPVQYVLAFTATIDFFGAVNGSVDSVLFKSLATPLTGSGSGTLSGTLDEGTLSAQVTGQFTTSTGGACSFTGPLTAQAQPTYQLRFATVANLGTFGFGTTPSLRPFPVGASGFAPTFKVFFDDHVTLASEVFFTGPAGSGITAVPADDATSDFFFSEIGARYVLRPRPGNAPGGTWTVVYKGQPRRFTVPPFNANASFVLIVPTVTVEGGLLSRIDWTYVDATTGAVLPGPPPSMAVLQVRVLLSTDPFGPQTGPIAPTTTTFDLTDTGFLPTWAEVAGIRFQYGELTGNEYELNYGTAFSVSLETRLENCYGAGTTGSCTVSGTQRRMLESTVTVPQDTVDRAAQACAITVQNESFLPGLGIPYDDLTCLRYTGTTAVPNGIGTLDVFSDRVDLSAFSNSPSDLMFRVGIQLLDPNAEPMLVETSWVNPEADPSTDTIFIPNPATPALKPTGFTLDDARLGQRQTISWTAPQFTVVDLSVDASVALSDGRFCSSKDVIIDGTQATFSLPASCFGRTSASAAPQLGRASVCVVYRGELGEVSQACWMWR